MSGEASYEAITRGSGSPGDGNIAVRNRTVSLESCDLTPDCPLGLQCTQLRGPLAGENTGFLLPPNPEKTGKTRDSQVLLGLHDAPCTGWRLPGVVGRESFLLPS